MTDQSVSSGPEPKVGRGSGSVVLTGVGVLSAYGHGSDTLLAGVLSGRPAFAEVRRFDVSGRKVRVAATSSSAGPLEAELVRTIRDATDEAGLTGPVRAGTRLFLAVHGDPDLARSSQVDRPGLGSAALAGRVAAAAGLAAESGRAYTSACVAASTAIADAAAMIARGYAERIVVAGGYLVESDQFALFDAGRALADDGQVRPFSTGRRGLLLGDGVGAVVLESATAATDRRAPVLARLAGWGRTGDAYHPCQPRPDGTGLARAITAALTRAGIGAADLGYLNAHGSGSRQSDPAETKALRLGLGDAGTAVPVSSTKALHGQALEASGVLELIVTLLVARKGMLPVNAGYLGPDEDCQLPLVLAEPRPANPNYAMSLNAAFGGANTALVLGLS
jgi:3-oxoacyl-[acyl-carrier-protein] synthase II